jgi:hypothetical protein
MAYLCSWINLVEELRHGPSATNEMSASAVQHGRDLSFRGFTVEQVVHDYGDVCQSVTELAVERGALMEACSSAASTGYARFLIACRPPSGLA